MFLSVRQAAKRIGITTSRLGTLIRQGRIDAIRVDSFYILREVDVDTFERLPRGRPGADALLRQRAQQRSQPDT